MRLWRAHGLGNDYLVLESGETLNAERVRALCDRHRGVGSDGVLAPFDSGVPGERGVRIWNPDGSVAEKSGNGLRIFAWWVVHRAGGPARFVAFTGSERAACVVHSDSVEVDMGPARVGALEALPLRDGPLEIWPVSVGNPHAVHFTEGELDLLPWRAWGAEVERHARFPQRTNVQFVRVLGPGALAVRIWERGAGETLASGSSACAAAAAAVASGRLTAGPVDVQMEGGTLQVQVSAELHLSQRGPVVPIALIETL